MCRPLIYVNAQLVFVHVYLYSASLCLILSELSPSWGCSKSLYGSTAGLCCGWLMLSRPVAHVHVCVHGCLAICISKLVTSLASVLSHHSVLVCLLKRYTKLTDTHCRYTQVFDAGLTVYSVVVRPTSSQLLSILQDTYG